MEVNEMIYVEGHYYPVVRPATPEEEAEAERRREEEEEQARNLPPTSSDYEAALAELGVNV